MLSIDLSFKASPLSSASIITRLFETVKERKANPKEGSYTNYSV
jgi:hypothetical protein